MFLELGRVSGHIARRWSQAKEGTHQANFFAQSRIDLEVGGPQLLLDLVRRGVLEIGEDDGFAGGAVSMQVSCDFLLGDCMGGFVLVQQSSEAMAGGVGVGKLGELLVNVADPPKISVSTGGSRAEGVGNGALVKLLGIRSHASIETGLCSYV